MLRTSRSFFYDALSRLKTASNPESAAINYTYYDNGNLFTKTDARNVVTTYAYDGLNRVKTRTYSGTLPAGDTPDVTYAYDSATPAVPNSKGRLTSVSSSVSTYSYTNYDALGRVLACTQSIEGQNYTMSYLYNLAGGMTSERYPSNKEVVTEYDAVGRIAGIKKDATTYYAGGAAGSGFIGYTAHGAIGAMKLGNTLWEHTNFNSRLQPEQIGLGTSSTDSSKLQLDYGYGTGTSNNGNVLSQRIKVIGSPGLDVRQDYTYDELNRLKTATEVTTSDSLQQWWKQTYDYDRWGNRAVRTPDSTIGLTNLTPQSAFAGDMSAFNQSNNRIQAAGFWYLDGVGNLTGDPSTGSQAMVYDAENKLTNYTRNGETRYSYDGDGRRVKKYDVAANVTTVFVYNAGGQLIAEYTTSTLPPVGGGGTSYLTTDHLGSTRVVTSGGATPTVKARYDYLPYGEEIGSTVANRGTIPGYVPNDGTKQKFTQKERDTESGLDYFGRRYCSSGAGRFTSVDPISGRTSDPQTFNAYAYVKNNPINNVDPSGAREIPANVARFVKDNLAAALSTAIGFDLSAGAILAVAGVESDYGTSRRARQLNDIFGMNAGGRLNHRYGSLTENYDAFGSLLHRRFAHVIGIHDAAGFIDALVSGGPTGRGFKYNDERDAAGNPKYGLLKTVITAFGFDFFDKEILDPVRAGTVHGVPFGDVWVYSLGYLHDLLARPATDPQRQAFLTSVYNNWVEHVSRIGTEQDPNIQNIRRSYILPGSNLRQEAEATYEYRVRQAFGG